MGKSREGKSHPRKVQASGALRERYEYNPSINSSRKEVFERAIQEFSSPLRNSRILSVLPAFYRLHKNMSEIFDFFYIIKTNKISAGFSDVWLQKENLRLSIRSLPD